MTLRVFVGLIVAGLLTTPALAAAPSAEQKAQFYQICVATSSNVPLCTCKADAAVKLVDQQFMAVILASMQGQTLAAEYAVPYNDYIVESTRACGMGM
jgi:hypothetical protein